MPLSIRASTKLPMHGNRGSSGTQDPDKGKLKWFRVATRNRRFPPRFESGKHVLECLTVFGVSVVLPKWTHSIKNILLLHVESRVSGAITWV